MLVVDALGQSDETMSVSVATDCGSTETGTRSSTGSTGGHRWCSRVVLLSGSGFLDGRGRGLFDRCRSGRCLGLSRSFLLLLGCGNRGGHRLSGVDVLSRCSGSAAGFEFLHTLFSGGELLTQFVVLLVETANLNDDLIKEIVDFVLVVPVAELHMLEPLVYYVFRRERHEVTFGRSTFITLPPRRTASTSH